MVPRKRTLLGRGSVVLALVHLARWVAPLEAYLPHQHRHGGLRMDPYPRQPPHGRTTDAAAATAGVTAGRRGGTRQQSAPPKPSFGRAVVVVQQAASAAAPQQQQHDVNTNVVATETAIAVPSTTKDLNDEIARLCGTGDLDRAMELLDRHQPHGGHDGGVSTVAVANHKTYTRLLTAYATSADTVDRATLDCVEDLWSRLQQQQQQQQLSSRSSLRTAYNAVILAWSKSYSRQAGHRCDELLTELWVQYNVTQNRHWCPLHSTYVSTLTAWARSQIGPRAAERAEAILQEMERWGQQSLTTAHLKPTATCYNIVLNAWSKSGAPEARERCERALQRMEELYFEGQTELQPNTISFNTVLDALAQCTERDSARRAEQLLEHMDQLSSRDDRLSETCRPDVLSFNSVLNGWARSRDPMAAIRADDILKHMEQRYADGTSNVQPDAQSYNTVLTAWARSKSQGDTAVQNAQQVLQRMEKAYRRGNHRARPNTISYNIIINALAQSKDPTAVEHALEILETMKQRDTEHNNGASRPDCVTYTTIITVLAKKLSGQKEAAEQSIRLLEELEDMYLRTGDKAYKPNIRTYTAVVHAIARSRTDPERAEEIVNRIERLYELGDRDVQPDCVCYDSLINAFGWSDRKGKSLKCYSIYQKMLDLYQSRRNVFAKPDIITCNSVLNACAYEAVDTEQERAAIMDVVVKTLEDFQSRAPKFGWPNHVTYANTLQAIDKHVADPQKRAELAEVTFWQCCKHGHVSVPVVTSLYRACLPLSWQRFANLMSDAIQSGENEPLHFNWRRLPREWTRFAPQPKDRRDSRPSQKRAPSRSSPIFKPSTLRLW